MANCVVQGRPHEALGEQERAMAAYAVKLTRTPSAMTAADLDTLRATGLSEEQTLDVVLITCLSNFMTRVAPALGIPVDRTTLKLARRWIELDDRPELGFLRGPLQDDPAPPTH